MGDTNNPILANRTTGWVIFFAGWIALLFSVSLIFILDYEVGGLLVFPVGAIAILWGWSMRTNETLSAQPKTRASGTIGSGLSAATANQRVLENLSESTVWPLTQRGALMGLLAGIAIKYLDTTITMFVADQSGGWFWVLITGCLIGSAKEEKLIFAPVVIWFLALAGGVQFNIIGMLGALLTTCLVGAAFGVPLGMMIGTVVGYLRRRSAQGAPEGPKPLIWGFVVPGATLVVLAWLYLGVFMPWVVNLLES